LTGEEEVRKAYESILGQDYEEAAAWFRKAIEQDPGNGEYHYKLSITCARSGKIDEALALARRAQDLDPGVEAYSIQVRTLEGKRLAAKAERMLAGGAQHVPLAASYLRRAVRLDPLEEGPYVLLAAALARMKEYREAAAVLRELLELNPEHGGAQSMLEQMRNMTSENLED